MTRGCHRLHPVELLVQAYELHTAGLTWSEIHHRLRPGLRDAINRAKRYGLNR